MEGSDVACFKVLFRNSPGVKEETTKSPSEYRGNPTRIRTMYLQNTYTDHCRYTSLVGSTDHEEV